MNYFITPCQVGNNHHYVYLHLLFPCTCTTFFFSPYQCCIGNPYAAVEWCLVGDTPCIESCNCLVYDYSFLLHLDVCSDWISWSVSTNHHIMYSSATCVVLGSKWSWWSYAWCLCLYNTSPWLFSVDVIWKCPSWPRQNQKMPWEGGRFCGFWNISFCCLWLVSRKYVEIALAFFD